MLQFPQLTVDQGSQTTGSQDNFTKQLELTDNEV